MKRKIIFELPEDVFSAIKEDPESFTKELRIAASVKWYEMGKISQEKAAEIAGLSRKEFIEILKSFKVSPLQYDKKEIEEELGNE